MQQDMADPSDFSCSFCCSEPVYTAILRIPHSQQNLAHSTGYLVPHSWQNLENCTGKFPSLLLELPPLTEDGWSPLSCTVLLSDLKIPRKKNIACNSVYSLMQNHSNPCSEFLLFQLSIPCSPFLFTYSSRIIQ